MCASAISILKVPIYVTDVPEGGSYTDTAFTKDCAGGICPGVATEIYLRVQRTEPESSVKTRNGPQVAGQRIR